MKISLQIAREPPVVTRTCEAERSSDAEFGFSDKAACDWRLLDGFFAEFQALADHLGMPPEERRTLAGISEESWFHVCLPGGTRFLEGDATLRRLSYVVPLMRKTLARRCAGSEAALKSLFDAIDTPLVEAPAKPPEIDCANMDVLQETPHASSGPMSATEPRSSARTGPASKDNGRFLPTIFGAPRVRIFLLTLFALTALLVTLDLTWWAIKLAD